MRITALLRDKNGFEMKIKISEPFPVLEIPDYKEPRIGNKEELMRNPLGDNRLIFHRKERLKPRTFLYTQISL